MKHVVGTLYVVLDCGTSSSLYRYKLKVNKRIRFRHDAPFWEQGVTMYSFTTVKKMFSFSILSGSLWLAGSLVSIPSVFAREAPLTCEVILRDVYGREIKRCSLSENQAHADLTNRNINYIDREHGLLIKFSASAGNNIDLNILSSILGVNAESSGQMRNNGKGQFVYSAKAKMNEHHKDYRENLRSHSVEVVCVKDATDSGISGSTGENRQNQTVVPAPVEDRKPTPVVRAPSKPAPPVVTNPSESDSATVVTPPDCSLSSGSQNENSPCRQGKQKKSSKEQGYEIIIDNNARGSTLPHNYDESITRPGLENPARITISKKPETSEDSNNESSKSKSRWTWDWKKSEYLPKCEEEDSALLNYINRRDRPECRQ